MIRLLDLSGLFWTTWHGAAGQPPNYTYERVTARVQEYTRDRADDGDGEATGVRVAICLDSPTNHRREIDPEYKANRPQKDAEAIDQLRRIEGELRGAGFPVWRCDGFEADDVIASAVTGLLRRFADARAAGAGAGETETGTGAIIEVVSADKDLMALVSDEDGVAFRSIRTGGLLREAEVTAKFGVGPSQMRDLLAIMGDASDNVPGAKGVGIKGAQTLLTTFGDLAGVLAAAQEDGKITPPSLEKNIRAALGDLDRSARLVTLRTDAVVDVDELFRPRVVTVPAAPRGGFDESGFSSTDTAEPVATQEQQEPAAAPPARAATPAPRVAKPVPDAQFEPVAPRATTTSTALAVAQTTSAEYMLALEPRDLRETYKLARSLYDSGLFSRGPSGHSNVESVFAIILTGRTMGLDAMTALRGIDLIKGKPRLSTQMLVGLVLRSGLAKYFTLIESTNERATYRTLRKGDPEPVEFTYTLEDAEAAGKLREQGPWQTQRRTMLRWRCASELARAVFPDVAANVYTPGELEADEEGAAA